MPFCNRYNTKLLNADLDKIEKQKVEEMVSEEQHVQVELKKVLDAMETKRTDFDNIRQDVNKVKKYAVTDTTPNLETSFTKDSNSDKKSSFSSKRS
jgi:regulator of replication initiation timing